MKPLEPPDRYHLLAASGWLDLGDTREATEELERIAPRLRAHPDVLELRWQIYAEARNWDACVDIATAIVEQAPDRASGWLHRGYALRRATRGTLQAAWDALLPAAEKFPDVHLIPFNLACYACQMRRLPEARDWLKRAFDIAGKAGARKRVRRRALDDPDLEPLWKEIGRIEP